MSESKLSLLAHQLDLAYGSSNGYPDSVAQQLKSLHKTHVLVPREEYEEHERIAMNAVKTILGMKKDLAASQAEVSRLRARVKQLEFEAREGDQC